jgi:hypothetical protein
MCPFCIANVGLVVASTVSTGGLATLAIKVFRKKNQAEETASNAKEKENEKCQPAQWITRKSMWR